MPRGEPAELHLSLPEVANLVDEAPRPLIRGLILQAVDGEWEEVDSGGEDLDVTVESGVYRAEVRMVPEHLRASLGSFADTYLEERIWVYSNPIYVGVDL